MGSAGSKKRKEAKLAKSTSSPEDTTGGEQTLDDLSASKPTGTEADCDIIEETVSPQHKEKYFVSNNDPPNTEELDEDMMTDKQNAEESKSKDASQTSSVRDADGIIVGENTNSALEVSTGGASEADEDTQSGDGPGAAECEDGEAQKDTLSETDQEKSAVDEDNGATNDEGAGDEGEELPPPPHEDLGNDNNSNNSVQNRKGNYDFAMLVGDAYLN